MSDLRVTFSRPASNHGAFGGSPILVGRFARSEVLAIGETSAATTAVATTADTVARVKAGADCWVTIGADPTAESGSGWPLSNGDIEWFQVRAGDKVAVIADAE